MKRLDRVEDLREAWKNEERDFTPWLADNLDQLGTVVGLDLEKVDVEHPVGRLSLDILARDRREDTLVAIENQLECANYDHLAKCITYGAGVEARHVIWVMKAARPEYRNAIRWLNEHTDGTVGYHLVELQLWRVLDEQGNAEGVVPLFSLVESPEVGADPQDSALNREYWGAFVEYAARNAQFIAEFSHFGNRQDRSAREYIVPVGRSYYLKVCIKPGSRRVGVALSIERAKNRKGGEALFNRFYDVDVRAEIEREIPGIVIGKQYQDMTLERAGDPADANARRSQYDWMMEMLLKFKEVFGRLADEDRAEPES